MIVKLLIVAFAAIVGLVAIRQLSRDKEVKEEVARRVESSKTIIVVIALVIFAIAGIAIAKVIDVI